MKLQGCLPIVAMKLQRDPADQNREKDIRVQAQAVSNLGLENPQELPEGPRSHCLIHICAECKAAVCKKETCLHALPRSTQYTLRLARTLARGLPRKDVYGYLAATGILYALSGFHTVRRESDSNRNTTKNPFFLVGGLKYSHSP